MNRRVNGLGVSEAEVQTQGDRQHHRQHPQGHELQAGPGAGRHHRQALLPAGARPPRSPAPPPTASPSPSASSSASPRRQGHRQGDTSTSASPQLRHPVGERHPQGRAVTDALKADATPSPSASRLRAASASPSRERHRRRRRPPSSRRSTPRWTAPRRRSAPRPATASSPPTPPSPAARTRRASGRSTSSARPRSTARTSTKAKAVFDTAARRGWIVTMDFTAKGAKKFADITGKLAQNQSPQNQFAIVLDGEVVSAPSVNQALTGGSAEISGSFNQESAAGPGQHAVVRRAAADLQGGQRHHRHRRARRRAAAGRSDRRRHRPRAGRHLPGGLLPRPVAHRDRLACWSPPS